MGMRNTPRKNGHKRRQKENGSNKGTGMGMGMALGTAADTDPFNSQAGMFIAGVAIVVALFVLGVGLGFVKSSKATKKRRPAADELVINFGLDACSETGSDKVRRNPLVVEAFD